MSTSETTPSSTLQTSMPKESRLPVSAPSSWSFTSKNIGLILAISLVVLVPCFWLPKIEAGDLASHSYNAWLASLVEKGSAPGLWIAPQHNNVLTDILLLELGKLVGFSAAEKIVAAMAVLIFVWGAFALATVASGRLAWPALPLLAMLAYGWTFHMGFFNFYFSLGLSFVALAIVWQSRWRTYPFLLLLLPLIWLAHPLGLGWFVGIAVYVVVTKWLDPRWHWVVFLSALGALYAVSLFLSRHYQVRGWPGHFYDLNGTDQFILGSRYTFIPLLVLLAVAGCTVLHGLQLWGSRGKSTTGRNYFPVPLQLFL